MPYRSVLGGSPLGIVGVRSAPSALTGLSTFPIDKSRNVVVAKYNSSLAGSLFTGRRRFRAWPKLEGLGPVLDKDGKAVTNDQGESVIDYLGTSKSRTDAQESYKKNPPELHSNTIYDTSIINIVEKLAGTKAELRPQDFAYLKNLGVFPNNRLMIARRFGSPVPDNIMLKKSKSDFGAFATMITWKGENDDFLELNFGEEWEPAEADFKGILNSLGEDLGLGNLGGIGGAAGNIVPLPGFTEIFQREFLSQMGLLENSAANQIPAGNPNLIKEAKRRKTIGYSEAGSGLSAKVSIKFVCEYELKYISGIDPTIVWMDILSNVTRFGTSESANYGLKGSLAAKLIKWANNPSSLITDVTRTIKQAVGTIISFVTDLIKKAYEFATSAAAAAQQEETGETNIYAEAEEQKSLSTQLLNKVSGLLRKISVGLILKYRVRILGIVNALSGLPSTPWHVTIGNPLRPVFCSGDMLCSNVDLKLGSQLAFNDLPSSITAEFTLTNARNLGLQEIMGKFNSGYIRVVDVQKSFYETDGKITNKDDPEGFVLERIGLFPEETNFVFTTSGNSGSGTASNSGTQSTPTPSPPSAGTSGPAPSPGANAVQGGASSNISNSNSDPSGATYSRPDGSVGVLGASASENITYSENSKLPNKLEANTDPNGPAFNTV